MKTVDIRENGVQKTFWGVKDIYTGDVWVPEDGTKKKNIIVYQNGEYTPNGFYAYDEVNVGVIPRIGTKNITENGTFYAEDDGLDAYSIVNVGVGVDLEFEYEPEFFLPASGAITYDTVVVKAKYSNGVEKDVTDECVFYPPEGTPISSLGGKPFKIIARWTGGINP